MAQLSQPTQHLTLVHHPKPPKRVPAPMRLAHIVSLEAPINEAEAAQSALAAAEDRGVSEDTRANVRKVLAAKVAQSEHAKPLIFRAGEAQEKMTLLAG